MNPLRWKTLPARALLAGAVAMLSAPALLAQGVPPALDDEIASRQSDGSLAIGLVGAVSADGRYVLFHTSKGLYRRDRVLGLSVRVDVDANGQNGGSGSATPSISADGRFVSFQSNRPFGTADTQSDQDIWLKDMDTGAIERVSVKTGGGDILAPTVSFCTSSSISANGNRVAFACGEGVNTIVVFVRDRSLQQTYVASVNLGGGQTSGSTSGSPSISADGRYVGFVSDAANLVAGDTNATPDAFVRDLQLGTTIRVSLTSTGSQIPLANSGVQNVHIAANCLAAFDTGANGVVPGDGNNAGDVYIRNWCGGTTELASATAGGAVAVSGDSSKPWLSADGRYVAFQSNAALTNDFNFTSGTDTYVRDRTTGGVSKANPEFVEGQQFDAFAIDPALSADGRQVIMYASGGSVGDHIVALRNPLAETLPFEDVAVAAFGSGMGRHSLAASVSADGSKVVFVSGASGFDRGWGGQDSDSVDDVFIYDYSRNCVEQASMSHLETNGDCDGTGNKREAWQGKGVCAPPEICSTVMEPSLEAGGRFAVFVTADAAVAKFGNETEAQARARRASKASTFAVVLRNLVTNATFRLGTGTANGNGSEPRVAPGGGSVVFVSGAGLVGTDANAQPDVYRQRIKPDGSPDGAPECVSCKDGNDATLPGGAGNPAINAGGTVVAFDQPNGSGGRDIVIRNLVTGATQRAGTSGPPDSRNSTQPTLDWSGTMLAFESATPLAAGDTNAFSDVYAFDIAAARLALMSGGNGHSREPSFAGDGKSLAYVTQASDLDPDAVDANGFQDVHVQQVTGGALTGGRRATLARNRLGGFTDGASARPAMSYNGTVVAFDSAATNMLGEGTDENQSLDVFTRSVPFNAERLFGTGFE